MESNKGNIKLANVKNGEPYDIYIGRANKWLNLEESKWKNPFPLRRERDRDTVLLDHLKYMLAHPELIADLIELKNKTLGCYCFSSLTNTGKKCHGHNLIFLYDKFVNE